jgi:hypothetical protein
VAQAIQSEKEIYNGDSKKKQLPPFLDQNPDITTKIYLCTWEFLFGMHQ